MDHDRPRRPGLPWKLAFSLFLFLAGLELMLQAAHYLHAARQPEPILVHPGAPVILCLGDSHTYGVKVPAEESYPAQLQKLLDEQGLVANVINAGVPGQNTSELRRLLPELLERYRPQVVVIMSCANNDWNRHDVAWSDLQDGVLEPGVRSWLKRLWYGGLGSLRTVRLVTYLWNETARRLHPLERVVDHRGNVYFHDWGGVNAQGPKKIDRTYRDLWNMVATVEDFGTRTIFMTYAGKPSSPMLLGNQVIRNIAATLGVPLVDNDLVIKPMFTRPDGSVDQVALDRLFLTDPGETHLAPAGYAVMSRNLFESLLKLGLLGSGQGRGGPAARD